MRLEIADDDLFGFHNLPYGVYSLPGVAPRVATRVGDWVVDLAVLLDEDVFAESSLNAFMARGPRRWSESRARLAELVAGEVPAAALHALSDVRLHLPFAVGDYVDFYASEHHATNLGRLFRPDSEPLLPNWRHLPVGYHGRAGSVVVSGTDVRRPVGQRVSPGSTEPVFEASAKLDYEAEIGFVVGQGSPMGTSIPVDADADHVFGVVLLNDWSARDIQAWEYQPLGPHLGKSFATTISPWVVPLSALSDARVPVPRQEPEVLPYLAADGPWGLDLAIEVEWNGQVVSRPPYASTYWSPAQMLAHLTSNGAPTRPGDLFASGTVSGRSRDEVGSAIELTRNGAEPIVVAGEERTFLEDGDELVLRATAPAADGCRLGFGEARGRVLGARAPRR
ncbi:fumarylacetoacetase [Nocardioides montaniterrae]